MEVIGVRARLRDVADRVQQSGWLVPAGSGTSPEVLISMLSAAGAPVDRLRGYAPCRGCARQARWLPATQPFTLLPVPGWGAG